MPPFAGLLAFEAVLRHGSMTLAGDELGLTQSAVSHRIQALEGFFGVALLSLIYFLLNLKPKRRQPYTGPND